jgi:hypothetical protein
MEYKKYTFEYAEPGEEDNCGIDYPNEWVDIKYRNVLYPLYEKIVGYMEDNVQAGSVAKMDASFYRQCELQHVDALMIPPLFEFYCKWSYWRMINIADIVGKLNPDLGRDLDPDYDYPCTNFTMDVHDFIGIVNPRIGETYMKYIQQPRRTRNDN